MRSQTLFMLAAVLSECEPNHFNINSKAKSQGLILHSEHHCRQHIHLIILTGKNDSSLFLVKIKQQHQFT